MGSNYSSEENVHNAETHEQLQKSINNLLNLSNSSKSNRTINTYTDTNMTFNKNDVSVSTPVTEILKDITEFDQVAQTGGGAQDKLTVIPTRMRYGLPIKFDAGINRQVNKNLLQDELFIGGNNSKLSVKSDNNFSATSKESKNVFSATSKNSKSTFSSTSISDKDFQILKNVVLKHSQNGGCGLTQTAAGCGCGGSDTKLSITSENPIRYDAMIGGNDEVAAEAAEVKKEKKVKKEDEDEDLFDDDDKEDDEDEVSSSDKSTTEGTKSVSDNSTTDKSTATTETTESAKSSEQSRAKGRKSKKTSKKTAKKTAKKSKRTKRQKGGTTTETQSSNNIDINTKYLYSSNNNTQFETENQSEYYKTYKNRSLIN